jgi:lactocepin
MILLQGACSDTVRFSLNKAGVLTISGTGSIPKYYYGAEGTHHGYWSYGYSDFIRKLVIEEGITKIEKDAFCGMNIAEVSLPDSLVTLEDYALDSNDFISIRIPANLRDIGLCAIRSINLFNISVDPANPYYDTWDNNLVSKDRKTLVVYGNRFDQGQLCSSYSIPEGIEVIGKSAFCGVRSFENVFFPETVISIEEEAFALCSYATFQLPESLESIGKRAS